jgi:transcriptional regulator with XRE-family HTH domain
MSTSKNRLRQAAEQVSSAEKRFYRKNDEVVARIRDLLDERGLTQKELAEKVDKTPSYVSRVLGGAVNLTLKTITEFEDALDADILAVPSEGSSSPLKEHRRYETESEYTETPTASSSRAKKSRKEAQMDAARQVVRCVTFGRSQTGARARELTGGIG